MKTSWHRWQFFLFVGEGNTTITLPCHSWVTWSITSPLYQPTGPDNWSSLVSLFTEKKVEIFHSLLRENSNQHDDGKSLSEVAKVIASCGFLSAFKECFVPVYHGGVCDNNIWLITGKAAEFLLGLFQKIASNSGKAHKVCSYAQHYMYYKYEQQQQY